MSSYGNNRIQTQNLWYRDWVHDHLTIMHINTDREGNDGYKVMPGEGKNRHYLNIRGEGDL